MTLAERILAAVGGPKNVTALTRCFGRLRFVLLAPAAVDEVAVQAIPEVAIGLHQHGEYQIALLRGMSETYDELTELLHR